MVGKLIIDSSHNDSIHLLRDCLFKEMIPALNQNKQIVILCIGTDRSTGDSLGPLVGDKLKFLVRDKFTIYGDLEHPVHAKNLSDTLTAINKSYANPYIIAVDACLGSLQHVGCVVVENKPLNPGAAMNKDLPPVGNLSITGIVNISGSMEFMVLQNTRLYTVMLLADLISKGIYHSILKISGGRKSNCHKRLSKNMMALEEKLINDLI